MTRQEILQEADGMFETYSDKMDAVNLAIEVSNKQLDAAIKLLKANPGYRTNGDRVTELLESLKI